LYLGGTDVGKPKVVLQEVLQRKSFLKPSLSKSLGYAISIERNYIISEVSFSPEI
jgi:hypothetical protein